MCIVLKEGKKDSRELNEGEFGYERKEM